MRGRHLERASGLDALPQRAVIAARRGRWSAIPALLRKVFAVDVLGCSCGGRLQLIAFIAEATVAKRILDHLGLDSRGPPLARAQAPPDPLDPAPSHDGTDPVFPD